MIRSDEKTFGQETPKESWSYSEFKEHIIDAETHLPPGIETLPQEIDVGTFDDELQKLVGMTAKDPRRREVGLGVKLDFNGRLMMQTTPTWGDESSVNVSVKILTSYNPLTPQYARQEPVVMTLHSHPLEHPASPRDFSSLVVEQEERGTVAEMLGTPGINFLFLRTRETTEVPIQELERWVETWGNEITRRYRENIPMMATLKHQSALAAVINNSVLRDITYAHTIAVYSSTSGSIYTKARL